ncbi:AI-2E family transporter [Miltoncostaea oceani]|uniref:AI-2E family transporter n=1 Tax=Miltoncostaea oceani TaxID=2843216 RepID=UPI001C3DA41D|nr:AI-2E family transporter [Miltoncostaea oceani]
MRSDGLSTRALLRMVGVLFAVLAGLYLLWLSRGVITWVVIGGFLAVAMNPLVSLLQVRLRMRRAAAIFIVYLAVAGVIAGAALLFVPPLIDAGQQLTEEVPTYVEQLSESELVQQLDEEYDVLDRIEEEATSALGGVAGPDTAVELATRVINGLVALISIAVIAFLLSLYGPRAHDWVLAQQHGEKRVRLQRVSERVYRVISGYVVGVFLVAMTGGVAVWIFLTIIDVPFALLLAFWAGFASLVPLVGATIGGIPYIAVAFFQGWPIGVAAIVFLIVYQQIENNLFQPMIHRFTVQLNPLWIILAVLVGATLIGVVGALMAIPAAGIAQVLIQEWWAARQGGVPPALAPQEPSPEP